MTTRVTFVTGTAEVKRRGEHQGDDDALLPPAVQPVTYVDGRCTCCPYGYHIDLDFLNFCKNVAEGTPLSNLKRIQRTKRQLRKSMEVMLHQQQQQQQQQHGDSATATLASATPPPDVVHSTEASRLINMVQYEQSATHRILREIDSSVNATLASIESVQQRQGQHVAHRYTSSDSEDAGSPTTPPLYSHTLPARSRISSRQQGSAGGMFFHLGKNGDESSHFATSLSTSGRTDSLSSLSSVSTVSSEQVPGMQYTSHASGMLNIPHETATAQVRKEKLCQTSVTAMTSEKLAATLATHFPEREEGELPSSPMSPTTTISKASLAAIREAMAVSLQRLRDLEEQVKAIPVLQVRISVLKEEKRLLALQLKAKSGLATTSVRSIGVGDDTVDSPDHVVSPKHTPTVFSYPTATSPFSPLASSPRLPSAKTPPPTLPKPTRVKTVAIGDHSVMEPYLLQPDLPTGFTIKDNRVETRIQIGEQTFVGDSSWQAVVETSQKSPGFSSKATVPPHFTISQIQRSVPKPMTRSVGVGEGNVHDTSVHVHEKELRTVIIGGNASALGKRNVGVEVKVPTRSIGVSYTCDDARPPTRTVGVNVTYDTSNVFTSLDFRGEAELRTALMGVLQRNVRSVGTSCDFSPPLMDTGVQHEAVNMVSVGSGGEDCRVDVDIRHRVSERTIGIIAKPEVASRMVTTAADWVLDAATNTVSPEIYNKGCNTENRRLMSAATATEERFLRCFQTQTDALVFHSLGQVKHASSCTSSTPTASAASNTVATSTNTVGVNTKASELVVENFDFEICFQDGSTNTVPQLTDQGMNTLTISQAPQLDKPKVVCIDIGVGDDTVDGVFLSQIELVQSPSKRPLTLQEQIIQRGASQATAFLGSTSSSGSMSPTSPSRRELSTENGFTKTVVETMYTTTGSHTFGENKPEEEALNQTTSCPTGLSYSDFRDRQQRSQSSGLVSLQGGQRAQWGFASSGSKKGQGVVGLMTVAAESNSEDVDVSQQTGDLGGLTRSDVKAQGLLLEDSQAPSSQVKGQSVVSEDLQVISSSQVRGQSMMSEDSQATSSSQVRGQSMMLEDSQATSGSQVRGQNMMSEDLQATSSSQVRGQSVVSEDSQATSSSQARGQNMMSEDSQAISSSQIRGQSLMSEDLQAVSGGVEEEQTVTGSDLGGGRMITSRQTTIMSRSSSSVGGNDGANNRVSTMAAGQGGGLSYLERFGFIKTSGKSVQSGQSTESVSSGQSDSRTSTSSTSQSSVGAADGELKVMETPASESSLRSSVSEIEELNNLLASSGLGGLGNLSGKQELIAETAVVKRPSAGSKMLKSRYRDGGRLSQELMLESKGIFSGQRVGSVEDFMPDDIRRLMNIDAASSSGGTSADALQASSEGTSVVMAGPTVTRTVHTVTTKKTSSKDGSTTTSVTKTVTSSDGVVTSTTTTEKSDPSGLAVKWDEGSKLGNKSVAQLDLSKVGTSDTAFEAGLEDWDGSRDPSEQSSGGIKDSGFYESSTLAVVEGGPQEASSASSVEINATSSLTGSVSPSGSLERRELKSIMKRPKVDAANTKKGITFAESVVGGTGSSSDDSNESESDSESTTSYEEGSYDSREGDITYQCHDDEVIAQKLPGARMYDQNIRETYELSEEMRQACDVLATYLVDSTTIQTKQLNASTSIMQAEWFRVSSHKLSSSHEVEDYLSSINEISHRLLEYVVNMVDTNGNAAIHYSVSHCNFDIVGLLLDTEVCDVQRPNKAGYTPAMLAALAYVQSDEHREIVRRLFAASSINAQAQQTGQTALMLAVSHGRADMVRLLLEEGANCNIQDFDGSTALMCACEHGQTAIVQMLLAQPSCDANLTDNENSTALSIAMEAGHKDIGVILYKHLNFSKSAASPAGFQKKKKGSTSPTPRHLVH